MKFSVLLSVYEKENHHYLKESLDSILVNQSVVPDELIIVKDGPLTAQLDDVIDEYKERFSSIIKIISLSTNRGLGEALRIGLTECSFDIVARMDSDDINHHLRFERQLKVFEENPDIDLVGSYIAEFFDTPYDIKFIRKVPSDLKEIRMMAKRRNPINHVSVMFKKSSVLNSGSYRHLNFLEDYYLWIRMLSNGFKLINTDEVLVYVRTGENMFKRRSNPVYIKSWFQLQKEMLGYGLINKLELILNMINIVIFIYTPPTIKRYLYKWVLRSNIEK